MIFNVRPLNDNDYDTILCGWWKDWGWDPPKKDFLPDNGVGGVMILDGEIPVCAGFMYATNSKIAWIEFIISNKDYRKKPERKNAMILLVETLTNISRNTGYKYCYTVLKNKGLIETYKSIGYETGSVNINEMIKIL
jgi:hypothetical protein